MTEDALKVMVVDDTVTYRKILSDVVQTIPGAELAGAAPTGAIALKKLAQMKVDIVLLDVFMPEMDGVETLSHIRKEFPDVFTIMISGATTRHADITIKALEMGAIDFVPKPTVQGYDEGVKELSETLKPILRMIKLKRLTGDDKQVSEAAPTPEATKQAARAATRFSPPPRHFDMLVIGVSTGGPNALRDVIMRLPADLPVPVLIVQHMPPLFTASLARNLSKDAALAVREAQEGETVAAGSVLIAPGGRHMTVRSGGGTAPLRIGLNDSPPVNSCRPSVDVLFRSVAMSMNGGVLAVILTGMGDDGADGVAALKRKGCYCIAQNEETCVVYGMPRSVVERGLSDEIVPLDNIAGRIVQLVGGKGS